MSVKVGMRTRYCENLASAMISELANLKSKEFGELAEQKVETDYGRGLVGNTSRVVWNSRRVSSRSAPAHAAVAAVPRGLQMPPRLGLGPLLCNSTGWSASAAPG